MSNTCHPARNYLPTCLLLTGLLLINGCATSSQSAQIRGEQRSEQRRHPAPIQSIKPSVSPQPAHVSPTPQHLPDSPVSPAANKGVAALLSQAAQARASGDISRAQSLAERAQTLDPREARCYLELARIHEHSGNTDRARQMARRGLSVANSSDIAVQQQLQWLAR